jgi:hypothetical protein
MWELICNRRLFSGLDDLAALRAVREANVPRPTEIDPRLPPEIDQILMTALARDKQRRYPTSGQLGQKLRSLRYSLDVTSGDPATELARIIDSTEEVERQSERAIATPPARGRMDFDGSEATVIRIRTAAEFSARDNDASISQARQVIDRFEEEETRLAALSSDQMRMLRQDRRARRDSEEEMTRARPPIVPSHDDDEPALRTPTDDTRLIAPRDRRTPVPGVRTASPPRQHRPQAAPPSPSPRSRGPTPGPPLPGMPPPRAPAEALAIAPPAPPRDSASVLPMAPMPQPPEAPLAVAAPQPLGASAPAPGSDRMQPGGAPAFAPPQPAGGYPSWAPPITAQRPAREATPTARDSLDRPAIPNQPAGPQVAGFARARKPTLQPWLLVIGALAMAALAFAITRALIG